MLSTCEVCHTFHRMQSHDVRIRGRTETDNRPTLVVGVSMKTLSNYANHIAGTAGRQVPALRVGGGDRLTFAVDDMSGEHTQHALFERPHETIA